MTSNGGMILGLGVNYDTSFKIFGITIKIAPSQIVKPLPFCLPYQSSMQCNNAASLPVPITYSRLMSGIKDCR